MPTLKLKVEGLADREAETQLADRLRAEDGVMGAVASCETGCVEVDFEDDRVSVARILEVVEGRGLQVSLGG